MSKSLLDIEFKSVKGETKTLKDFSAKMYLVVNTASKCGLTPQYEALQAVYGEYHAKGLEIIAFPANEFLGQEPGSDNEIQEAERIDQKLQPLHKSLFIESNPSPVKYAASLLNLCSDEVRLPLVKVTEETKKIVKSAMVHANLI